MARRTRKSLPAEETPREEPKDYPRFHDEEAPERTEETESPAPVPPIMPATPKRRFGGIAKAILAATAFFTGLSSYYSVGESEQAVVTRFGNPVRVILNPIDKGNNPETERLMVKYAKEDINCSEGAGLRFKIPFIDSVIKYNRKEIRWNGYPEQITTRDKKYIWVETTARAYITDPLEFLRTIGTEERPLHGRLDDIIDSNVRNAVTTRNLIEIVRTDNKELLTSEIENSKTAQTTNYGAKNTEKVLEGRSKIMEEITNNSAELCKQYGITIPKDGVLITNIVYVDSVKKAVENRMIAERLSIAEQFRSQGEGQYNEIMGSKEKKLKEISSAAYKEVQEIRGGADAQAAAIYAEAYNKEPEFYQFMQTMKVYSSSLKGNTKLIIGTDNPLFKYLSGNQFTENRTNSNQNEEAK